MPDWVPTSPKDGSHIFDDFVANSAVADAVLSKLQWEITTLTTADTLSYVASQNGILRMTGAGAGDNTGAVYTLDPDHIVLAGSNQFVRARISYPNISGNALAGQNFRFGFTDSVAITEPGVGVWVDSNAGVLELDGASTNGDINQAVAGVSTLTSGTTMVLGTFHDLEIKMDGVNANGGPDRLRLFVDGELGATINNFLLGSTETMEFGIAHWQDTGGAASLELDVDYVEAWLPRN